MMNIDKLSMAAVVLGGALLLSSTSESVSVDAAALVRADSRAFALRYQTAVEIQQSTSEPLLKYFRTLRLRSETLIDTSTSASEIKQLIRYQKAIDAHLVSHE